MAIPPITDHAALSNVTANQHHNQAHAIDGGDHTASGLTTGHVLKATSATTFAFGALAYPAGTGVFVTHNAGQSVNNDADATLAFNTETVDTDAFHDTVTNNSRLTVPTAQDGTYQPVVALSFAADADGYRQVTILKNGSPVAGYTHRVAASPTLATGLSLAFPPLALVATDYLECRVHHTAGAAIDVESGSGFGMWLVAASAGAPTTADYWVETSNATLTAEVVVGTTGISTAAYASRQAAAKAGRLFLPSDGLSVERDTGSAWAPWGPIFPLTVPVDGDFTWINQGGASVNAAGGGIYLLAPAGASTNLRIRKKSAPATPYVVTACFLPMIYRVDNNSFGLLFRQSSDGKVHAFYIAHSTGIQWIGTKWTNATTFDSNYVTINSNVFSPTWMRIADNGTNRICSWSSDGQNWIVAHTVGRTDFLTADEIGFFSNSQNATYEAACTLISWKQT